MLDLLMSRRSIRKFKGREIEKEKIDIILKGALTAPSGRNIKPWELIVVTDKEVLANLGNSRGKISGHLAGAALGIVVIADPSATDIWIEDASILATVIQLIVQSLGLGSCWIQARERMNQNQVSVETYVKEVLNIPEKYRVESMIAIGYPDEEKVPHQEDNLAFDKIHYNKF